ncbi:hypothetical protein B0T16DRAFT_249414 [Cercophora newfieldiana]|uniref:Uncharacterized protein n=1 Tax=Cercophora newfieldiana TaxID=92897 RepID=A0AA39XUJ4_9PEZI|nr:hypothetical protein B0T16DRAFT_249414 [Cercophora newfieldiana]
MSGFLVPRRCRASLFDESNISRTGETHASLCRSKRRAVKRAVGSLVGLLGASRAAILWCKTMAKWRNRCSAVESGALPIFSRPKALLGGGGLVLRSKNCVIARQPTALGTHLPLIGCGEVPPVSTIPNRKAIQEQGIIPESSSQEEPNDAALGMACDSRSGDRMQTSSLCVLCFLRSGTLRGTNCEGSSDFEDAGPQDRRM